MKNNILKSVFIVAELSANHNGSLQTAIDTIKAAKFAGADAIKLQTYTPDTMTIDCRKEEFVVKLDNQWDGISLYDLYKSAYTPWEWHQTLFETAKKEGLICFSSPFDHSSIDLLEQLDNPIYKIASFEINDIPLIEYAASKGKPMIMSTGIADEADIRLAIATCRKVGNNQITLLKTTSQYPAKIEDANLSMIPDMRTRFGVEVGLSDHTMGSLVPMTATALGATVIEKHFILDRNMGGPDSEFSMNPSEFKDMVDQVRLIEKALGKIDYQLSEKALKSRNYARSIYVVKDLKAGETITKEHIKVIRPGFGLHPKYYHELIGKISKNDLFKGDRMSIEFIQ